MAVVDNDLRVSNITKIISMLESFSDIITDIPGETDATTHAITLTGNTPIKVIQYSLPLHCEEAIKTELLQILNAGVIEHSDSPFLCTTFAY